MNSDLAMQDGVESVCEEAKALRVLFVVDSAFPGKGGAEAQARKLAQALKRQNVSVKFLSPRTQPELAINDTVDGLPSHRIAYPKIRLLGALILLVKFAWYLYKHRKDFDVIHVHITRFFAAIAVLMKPVTGIPVITKVSGFFEFQGGVLDPNTRFNPANLFLRYVLRKVDYVQTISVETQQKLLQAGFTQKQICFIPNGIETEPSSEVNASHSGCKLADEGVFTFGYCGRLRRVKGIEVLLDSFAELVNSQPQRDVKLRIAGGGRALSTLKQHCVTRGFAEKVEFLGVIENTHSFYKSVDVYIQPSYAEGLPNSVMEAMVSGLPVLATDIGGNNELVDHDQHGWLFEAGNANALTVLMQRCLNEPHHLEAMGTRARERIVSRYDFATVTRDLLELYRGPKN